jgi:ribosomal protein S14
MGKFYFHKKNLKYRFGFSTIDLKSKILKGLISFDSAPKICRSVAFYRLDALNSGFSRRTRIRNRCLRTFFPRSFYSKFLLSRFALREQARLGFVFGYKKFGW